MSVQDQSNNNLDLKTWSLDLITSMYNPQCQKSILGD